MNTGGSSGESSSMDDNISSPTGNSDANTGMRRIMLVLPDDWTIEKIRYLQAPTGGQVHLIDMDRMDSPLDNPDSLLNYVSLTLKEDGPTGWNLLDED